MNFLKVKAHRLFPLILLFTLQSNLLSADIIVREEPLDIYQAYNFSNSYSIQDKESSLSGSLSEVLAQETNLNMYQSGGFGKQASFFMRGGNRGDQGIFINGVQLQDPLDINRSVDLGTLGADIFDQVDISFGPHQALFNDNSLSGTINLKTKKETSNHVRLALTEKNTKALTGSYNSEPVSLRASTFRSDNISSANEAKNSFAEADSFSRYSLYAEYRKKLSSSSKLTFFTYQHSSQNEIDQTNFSTNLPIDDRDDDLSTQKLGISSLQFSKMLPKQALQLDYLLNYKESHRESNGETYKGQVPELIHRLTYLGFDKSLITVTARAQREKVISGSSIEKRYLQQYFLGINQFYDLKKFKIQASLSSVKYESYQPKYQYQFGASYRLTKAMKLKYLHSRNIKFPSLYQLYAPESSGYPIGNLSLRPEETTAHDLQLSWHEVFQLSFYYQKYKNLIQYSSTEGYANSDFAKVFGLSPQVKFNHKNFDFNSSLNFMRTQANEQKQYLERRPKETFSHKLGYRAGKYRWFLAHNYIGSRNDSGRMPSYQLIDLGMQKFFPEEKINLNFKITNAANKKYEQIRGFGTFGRMAWLELKKYF